MEKNLRSKVLSHSAVLLGGRLIQMIFQIIMGLVVPKLVSPIKFGLWRSLMIIYQYATFSNLGTYSAMGLEMPYLAGKGDIHKRKIVKSNTFYFNVFISLFIGISLIISTLFLKGEYESFYRYGFILFSILIFSTNIVDFYFQLLRIEKEFNWLSYLTIIQTIINLVLTIGFLLYFDNVLVLAYSIIISNLITFIIVEIKFGLPKFINVQIREIWRLIVLGFPLLLNGILLEVIRGIDQVLIVIFLKPEQLGYYGLAVAIQRIGFLIPGVLASTTMPYIYEEYGRTNSIHKISQIFEKSLIIVSLICAFLVVCMYELIHLIIKYYLNDYLPSLEIMQILFIGMFSIGLLGLPELIIAITGKVKRLIKWQVMVVFITISIDLIVIQLGLGIFGVAIATVCIFLLYSLNVLYMTFKIFESSKNIIIKKIANLYFPYIYLLLALYLVDFFIVNTTSTFGLDILFSSLKVTLLLILYTPVLIYYDKKLQAFNTIKSSLKSLFSK